MKQLQAKYLYLLPGLIALSLLLYTGSRAYVLSMTHDESSTYLNWINQPVWECFFSDVCWGTANMHLVNTFLMQISVDIFGTDQFAVRLPNLLAHVLYLLFSYKLVRALTGQWLLVLGAFVLLNVHPYLLDFFSLARGYGLAVGFCMISLYYLYRFIETAQTSKLIWCLMGASLAVLSNFTFLNFFAILLGFLGIKAILIDQGRWSERMKSPGIAAAFAVVLGIFLINPIRLLQGKGEFGYGESSLWQTFQHLVQDNLYGQGYFGAETPHIFLWIAIVLVGISLIWGLNVGGRIIRERFGGYQAPAHVQEEFFFAVSLMWVLLIAALWVQHQWLGTQYPDHRTALIFFPLSALPVMMMMLRLRWNASALSYGFAVLISLFGMYHFSRASNWVYVREWYYDAHTQEMIEYLKEHRQPGEQIHLGVYWTFTHAANFYRVTEELDFLENIVYEREIRKDSLYDYYFVEPGHQELLNPAYELEKQFGLAAALYKRRPTGEGRSEGTVE